MSNVKSGSHLEPLLFLTNTHTSTQQKLTKKKQLCIKPCCEPFTLWLRYS